MPSEPSLLVCEIHPKTFTFSLRALPKGMQHPLVRRVELTNPHPNEARKLAQVLRSLAHAAFDMANQLDAIGCSK